MSHVPWFQASTKKQWCLQNKEPYCYYCLVSKSSLTLLQTPRPHQAPYFHGISQARILEWVTRSSFSKGTSPLRNSTPVSCIGGGFFTTEPPGKPKEPSDQIRSVAQSCPTLCDPMNRSTPGLPVHHQLPEFTQTHIHRVSDAIQPSHPLSSPSPPAPNPSQHQSLFQ